jgi:SOS-response transcriptional repressor LexA
MTDVAEKRRETLRLFIKERGLQIARWAKDSGVSANSIYNFLNGRSESLSITAYGKLARTAQVPSSRLTGERPEPISPTAIRVTGFVEAGVFQNADQWDSDGYFVDVPVASRFKSKAKALEVRGESMNLRYRPGSVVIWVDMLDYREPRHGDRVIVYRYKKSGEVEATVKELRFDGAEQWLWPLSNHPSHQQPISCTVQDDDIDTVEIKGIVIGSYLDEAD